MRCRQQTDTGWKFGEFMSFPLVLVPLIATVCTTSFPVLRQYAKSFVNKEAGLQHAIPKCTSLISRGRRLSTRRLFSSRSYRRFHNQVNRAAESAGTCHSTRKYVSFCVSHSKSPYSSSEFAYDRHSIPTTEHGDQLGNQITHKPAVRHQWFVVGGEEYPRAWPWAKRPAGSAADINIFKITHTTYEYGRVPLQDDAMHYLPTPNSEDSTHPCVAHCYGHRCNQATMRILVASSLPCCRSHTSAPSTKLG